jgi:uncharacterized protein (UPF0303 family)
MEKEKSKFEDKHGYKIIIKPEKLQTLNNWRKELFMLTEWGSSFDNTELNIKKRKTFQKYKVTSATEIAQMTELKQKVQAKTQRIRRYEKRKTQ